MDNLLRDTYSLSVTYIGCEPYENQLNMDSSRQIGPIYLVVEMIEIGQAVVTARIPTIRKSNDRFIVDMHNAIVARNKNLLQSLNYAPGVIVERTWKGSK